MRQIFGAIAEYEKTMIVLKLRGARQRARVRDGRCEGAKPFGSLPGEAEVLQRIKAMQAAGETGYTIANRLNAEGIASRRGTKWHPYAAANIPTRFSFNLRFSRSGNCNCQPHRYHLGLREKCRHGPGRIPLL